MRCCESNNPFSFRWFHKMHRKWSGKSLVPSVSVNRLYSLPQSSSIDLSLNLPWGIVRFFHPAWPVSAMCSTKPLFLMFATIFALISPLINGAIIEKRSFITPNNTSSPDVNTPPTLPNAGTAAAPGIAATPGTAAVPATPASLAASLAAPVTSPASLQITDPAPSGSAGCSWATCNLFYQVSDTSAIPNTIQD